MQEEYTGNGVQEPPHQPLNLQKPAVDYNHLIKTIAVWKGILNARLIAVFSLIGALFGFGFSVYDPTPLRLWAMGIYCVLCWWPAILLYLYRGNN